MSGRVIVSCLVLLAAASACLADEAVKYIACDPTPTELTPLMQTSRFAKPSAEAGTVNPHAMAISLRASWGIASVAIDSDSADDKQPNLLRIDFTGQGKFDKDDKNNVLPLKVNDRYAGSTDAYVAEFGPKLLQMSREGKTIPVNVWGTYQKVSRSRYLYLFVCAAIEGKCKFGEKTYPVRIIDSNNTLKFSDTPRSSKPLVSLRNSQLDQVVVDPGDGKFSEKSVVRSWYGQPVSVDGKMYMLKVAADQSSISAEPLDAPMARVHIDHDKWSATLVGDKYLMKISGGKEPVVVPADKYRFYRFTEYGKDESYTLEAYASSYDPKPTDVPADTTTELAAGTPLTGELTISQMPGTASISLRFADASGSAVLGLSLDKGKRPDAPKIEIVDSDGKHVYDATLEYG